MSFLNDYQNAMLDAVGSMAADESPENKQKQLEFLKSVVKKDYHKLEEKGIILLINEFEKLVERHVPEVLEKKAKDEYVLTATNLVIHLFAVKIIENSA